MEGAVGKVVKEDGEGTGAFTLNFDQKLFPRKWLFHGVPRIALRVLAHDALGTGLYSTRIAQIQEFRSFRGSNVISVDMEHLLHLYMRQQMIPFLRACRGFAIFIDHADKVIAPGYDPIGKIAFKAMMEEIRYLSNQSTVTILGVGVNGKALVETIEPSAAALFAFNLKLPDYTPLQIATIAADILHGSGFGGLDEPDDLQRLAELLDAGATKADARRTNALLARHVTCKVLTVIYKLKASYIHG